MSQTGRGRAEYPRLPVLRLRLNDRDNQSRHREQEEGQITRQVVHLASACHTCTQGIDRKRQHGQLQESPNTSRDRAPRRSRRSKRDRPNGLSDRPHRGQPAGVARSVLADTCYGFTPADTKKSEHKQVHDRGTGRNAGSETHLVIHHAEGLRA